MLPKLKLLFLSCLMLSFFASLAQAQETRIRKYAGNNWYARYDIKNGALQGWYKEYDTSNNLICENRIILPQDSNDVSANRIKSGLQKLYFTNGVCAYTAFFWSNRQIGPSLSRYNNGLPKCLHYSSGLELFWLPDSSLLYCKKTNAITGQVRDTFLSENQLKNSYKTLLQTACLKLSETESKMEVRSFDNEEVFSCGMKNGDLHGPFEVYAGKNSLFETGFYYEGKPCGEWNYYPPNKNVLIKQITYSKQFAPNALPLLEKEYNAETGVINKINRYKNGLLNGWQCTYHPNGMVADSFFVKNGISTGKFYSMQENGFPFRILNYDKKGKQTGLNRYWFMPPYGTNLIEEVNYKNGLREGKAKYYYPNGKLKMQGVYQLDKMEKTWFWFDTNGTVLAKLVYVNGKKINTDSLWVCHDEQASQRFITALESFIDLDSSFFAPWEFNYIAPVWPLVKNCFADYFDGGGENNYFFQLVAFEPIYFEIPKQGGIQLLLNPCWHLGEQSNIPTSVSFAEKMPEETRIRMEPKKLAYVFPLFLKDANGRNFSLEFNLSELLATPIEMSFENALAILPDTCYLQHSNLQLVLNTLQLNAPRQGHDVFCPISDVTGFLNVVGSTGKLVSMPINDLRISHQKLFLSLFAPEASLDEDWCNYLENQFITVENYNVSVKKEVADGKIFFNLEMIFK